MKSSGKIDKVYENRYNKKIEKIFRFFIKGGVLMREDNLTKLLEKETKRLIQHNIHFFGYDLTVKGIVIISIQNTLTDKRNMILLGYQVVHKNMKDAFPSLSWHKDRILFQISLSILKEIHQEIF